ncbi:MAG TPA: hypothetical protein VF235_05970 [Actinomycetota bacterium]
MRRAILTTATLALAMTACAESAPTGPGDETIEHPTDPASPILVVRFEGGFVPAEYLFTSLPTFALYGDGTLIEPGGQIEIYPGPALPAIGERTIAEDGIQAILRAAKDAGLDRDGDYSDLGNMGIADAATTVFELTVDDTTHRVSAYALGMEESRQEGQPDDVWAMREALVAFQTQLGALDGLVPPGSIGETNTYQGAAAQLLVRPYRPDPELPQEPVDWPLAVSLADAGTPVPMVGDDAECLVVSGEDWIALRALAERANQLTPWRQDGARFAIAFRPLLPDEQVCRYGMD